MLSLFVWFRITSWFTSNSSKLELINNDMHASPIMMI
ncbi:hypothetical protein CAEBREN_24958 [Caenorhabditis brenneri]|uniref:Uncharacterized protein n=1 Tax=Caenorhabditis brenneri TaxID=135651 RepID=G0NFF7_CAEBE|nr:hypothetical protein CAEBREN_24958 [Caenorhabditis brenneri]